jgi:hypothetical protein
VSLIKGIAAGLAGTLVVQLLSSGKSARDVFDPPRMAARLSDRYLGKPLSPSEQRRYGALMRWLYGSAWGALFSEAQAVLAVPSPLAAVGLGGTVLIFELVALPLTGATPQLSKWGWHQIGKDALQAMLFGTCVASTLVLLDNE